jgi:hypothetical protein
MSQVTEKTPADNSPVLREASAAECEAITGGFDDTPYCATPWSKIPPYPQLGSTVLVVNTGDALFR